MANEVSRRTILQLAMAPAVLSRTSAQGTDLAATASKVFPGPDGKLTYVSDEQGNTIHDASYAGYGGGGVAIPVVPVKETIWPVAADSTALVQAAIDKVSALPLDKNGFRGAVLLRAGYYKMAMPVMIRASGVVLRGEGMGDTGTVLIGTGTGRPPAPQAEPGAAGAPAAAAGRGAGPGPGAAGGPGPGGAPGPGGRGGGRGGGGGGGRPTLIQVGGASYVTLREETKQAIADEIVPVGARTFRVASARAFRPGDTVIVRRIGNQAWIDALGMNTDAPGGRWQPFNIDWDRVVVDVQGNTITVDAPISCAIEQRFGGGEVTKYEEGGRIANVGIENLRGVSEFDPAVRTRNYGNMDRQNYVAEEYYSDENHYSNFITFDNMKNGWVRNATALHFVYSMVGTSRGAKWVTVQDCVSREPISQRAGARRFVFALRGQLALVHRCQSDKGRHSFMTGQPTASNNVFLDCKATSPYSSSEPHEQWATGSLYDNIEAPLTARFWKNINIGWAGANTVFWNCKGDFLVQKPPTAQNYTFGHIGVNAVVFNIPLQDTTKENGHMESLDRHVTPRSLYLAQLRERLGEAAVRNIATPAQIG
jgi:hypothetical protein